MVNGGMPRKSKPSPVATNPVAQTPPAAPRPSAAPEPKEAAHPLAAWKHELGKLPDEVVAEHAGSSRKTVGEYRRKLNIDAYAGHRIAGRREPGTNALAGFIDMLGTTSDDVIAGIAGVAPTVVAAERSRRGIAEFVEEVAPAGAVNPLLRFRDRLGTVADAVIAAEAGVMRTTVGAFRRSLDIPAYEGHRTGRAAAEPAAVKPVAAKVAPPAPNAAPAPKAVPPTMATAKAAAPKAPAAKAAAPTDDPKQFRRGKLDAFAHLMGTMADSEIARMANSSVAGVKAHRARHGIKAWAAVARRTDTAVAKPAVAMAASAVAPTAPVVVKGTPGRKSKLDAHRAIIGVLSDASVAARADVTAEAVRQYRKRHSIEAATRSAGIEVAAPARPAAPVVQAVVEAAPVAAKAAPAANAAPAQPVAAPAQPVAAPAQPVAAPAAAPVVVAAHAGKTHAFRVSANNGTGTERFVVVASDIGAAAVSALKALQNRAAGPWAIRSVRDIGESL